MADRKRDVEKKIEQEEAHLLKMFNLALSGEEAANWEYPWRLLFSMGVIPSLERLNPEHAKGLRLFSVFYPGRTTLERISQWIRLEVERRDASLNRSAERIRADLPGMLWKKRYKHCY